MKKITAVLLALLLTLGGASALAQSVRFVEDSAAFDIEMPLPEGASVVAKSGAGEVSVVEVASEGLASVRITIAYSELYDETQSMNDLTDEEVASLKALAGSQYDAPEMTVDVTPSGNKYVHVCANSEYDVDAIFTLYKGYFVELTQWHDDYSVITDEDYAFMLQLLHNIEFISLQP